MSVAAGEVVPAAAGSWLASVASAQQMLAQVETVDEAASLIDAAEVAKVYARNVLRSRQAQNHAAHVSLLCQRKAGALLAEVLRHGGDRRSSSHDANLNGLHDLGVDKDQSSRWQRVAAIPEAVFIAHVETVRSEGTELTTAGVLRAVRSVIQSSESNEWYTPAAYIDAARTVMGGIDLDPASSDRANETVGADTYYTADHDGLDKSWHGRVWLNPPYGRLAGQFIERACADFAAGDIETAVCLVNAHCTDTRWFQLLWDHTLCFTDHRINFAGGTEMRSGSTHGSVFAYLGDDRAAFVREFSTFGAIVQRCQL